MILQLMQKVSDSVTRNLGNKLGSMAIFVKQCFFISKLNLETIIKWKKMGTE